MQSKRECYGQYVNEQGRCGRCQLALLCIDATIAADGYYDELARKEEEMKDCELQVKEEQWH